MSVQSEGFLRDLGDFWFHKNRDDLGKRDPVSKIIEANRLKPKHVLEVGCANGWLLRKLRTKYECYVMGIDPSEDAIADGADEHFQVGISTNIPAADDQFDLVIMGYSLWATPPEDWPMTVAEADRVLMDGGHLIINDYTVSKPIRKVYIRAETETYYQYYYDWAKLWTSYPTYRVADEHVVAGKPTMVCCSLLQKNVAQMKILNLPDD